MSCSEHWARSPAAYIKVIASQAIDLPYKVDMVGTLICERRANTPRRSFLVAHNGFSATGFRAELAMSFSGCESHHRAAGQNEG